MSKLLQFVDGFVDTIERTYNVAGVDDADLPLILGPLAEHYAEAKKLLNNDAVHALFVSIGQNGAYDVSTDDYGLIGLPLVVIDESHRTEGPTVQIDSQDGTSYKANVITLSSTAPHFDSSAVFDAAAVNTYANGQRLGR